MKLLGLSFKHIKGDLFGGITSGIVALPLALAFGLQSGMGAAAGLYGAIFISFFAAFFGGTNTQISGPTAPMTAVSMIVISELLTVNEGNLNKALPAILAVFLLGGLIQVALGILKVGRYIRYMPYPVVSGFMTGIGVIILLTQIAPLLGYYPNEDAGFVDKFIPQAEEMILEKILKEEAAENILVLDDFKETIKRAEAITNEDIKNEAAALASVEASGVIGAVKLIGRALKYISLADLIMGLLTIAIIYGFKYITRAVPSTLVALIVVSVGAYFLLPDYRTIGTIPSNFPNLKLSYFLDFNYLNVKPYLLSALSLALLGTIDSLLTSVVADNITKTKHNPDKELIGQGIGNSIAAFFGGIPGAGATIRTVVNIEAGGKTKFSGMISGLLLLAVLLLLGPTASKIPAAVLAGILITVGIGVMDYKGLKHIHQLPKPEVIVMLLVLVLTVFVGLIQAVAIGFILASLLFMKEVANVVDNRTKIAPLRAFSREIHWDDEKDILSKAASKVYIKHLDGPLFFGFASRFQDMIKALPNTEVVIIRMDKVPYVDQSGLYAMEDAIKDLQSQDIKVVFTDVSGQPLTLFRKFNIIPGLVEDKYCFDNFAKCSTWLHGYIINVKN